VESVRTPTRIGIGQNDEACHRHSIFLENTVVVIEHASRHRGVALCLYFDVDQHPVHLSVAQIDLDQLVGNYATGRSAEADSCQLYVSPF
jgi:hypothetical protein